MGLLLSQEGSTVSLITHCIRGVLDNLDTHKAYAFYEFLLSQHCLLSELEFHFTPVRGRWLNMAEIKFIGISRLVHSYSCHSDLTGGRHSSCEAPNICGVSIHKLSLPDSHEEIRCVA